MKINSPSGKRKRKFMRWIGGILVIFMLSGSSFAVTTTNYDDYVNHNYEKLSIDMNQWDMMVRSFSTTEKITREEFAKLLSLTFHLQPPQVVEPTFSDVTPEDWSFQYVESSKDYLTGYFPPNGEAFYLPTEWMRREDVAVALVRVLGIETENAAVSSSTISDVDTVSPQLVDEVEMAIEYNLITTNTDGDFRGTSYVDKETAINLVYRSLKSSYTQNYIDNSKVELEVKMDKEVYENLFEIIGSVDEGTRVYINDDPVDVYGGSFEETVLLNEEGIHEFRIKAVTSNGRSRTETRYVDYMIENANIEFYRFKSVSDEQTIFLQGKVETNGVPTRLYIDDYNMQIGSDGTFLLPYQLDIGDNVLNFVTENDYGKTTSVRKYIRFEPAAPDLVGVAEYPEVVTSKTIEIRGEVRDLNDDDPVLVVNDDIIAVDSNGEFAVKVRLVPGKNRILFEVKNKYNQSYEYEKIIAFEPEEPEMELYVAEQTSKARITAKARITNMAYSPALMKARINNEYVEVDSSGYFEAQVSLEEGSNTILFEAEDPDGLKTSIEKTIVFRIGSPKLSIDDIKETSSGAFIVSGHVYDESDRSPVVTVNGEPVRVDYLGNWKYLLETDAPDNEVIVVRAVNAFGKEAIVESKIK